MKTTCGACGPGLFGPQPTTYSWSQFDDGTWHIRIVCGCGVWLGWAPQTDENIERAGDKARARGTQTDVI